MGNYFISIDHNKNRFRFYYIEVLKDLFGGYIIIRHWGRIGTKGQCKTQYFDTEDKAKKEFSLIVKTREKHGYQEVLNFLAA